MTVRPRVPYSAVTVAGPSVRDLMASPTLSPLRPMCDRIDRMFPQPKYGKGALETGLAECIDRYQLQPSLHAGAATMA